MRACAFYVKPVSICVCMRAYTLHARTRACVCMFVLVSFYYNVVHYFIICVIFMMNVAHHFIVYNERGCHSNARLYNLL